MTSNEASVGTRGEFSVATCSVGTRRYALAILTLAYATNFIDRQVINILAEPIKKDLQLADWQIGLTTGLAFAAVYSFIGIPIARQAEHGNRARLISAALLIWGGFTLVCGFCRSFGQLLLARFGVGLGEAGCTPPALSLLSDLFPPEKRASAMGIYSAGAPVGLLLAMAVGGVVADRYGWRWAFAAAALPGVGLGILSLFTLPEPRYRAATAHSAPLVAVSFRVVLRNLRTKKTFWYLTLGASLQVLVAQGFATFTASFFLRNYGNALETIANGFGLRRMAFLGILLGVSAGIGGAAGAFAGGILGDKLSARDRSLPAAWLSVACLALVAVYLGAVWLPSIGAAVALLALGGFLGAMWLGPVYASIQALAPPQERATTTAVMLLFINLLGLGLGPLFVGAASDGFSDLLTMSPAESVRWALSGCSLISLSAAYFYWLARGTILGDLTM
jgi:MFS family permease